MPRRDFVNLRYVNTEQALAYAFVAHRVNEGHIGASQIGSSVSNVNLVRHFCNDTLNLLEGDRFQDIAVTDEDLAKVNESTQFFKRYLLGILAGSLTPFDEKIYAIVSNETVAYNDLGLLAFVPEHMKREKDRDMFKEYLKTHYSQSEIDRSRKISGIMEILEVRYVNSNSGIFRSVTAGMDGNLYIFSNNNVALEDTGKKIKVAGKFKKSGIEYKTKLPATMMNYVRVADV